MLDAQFPPLMCEPAPITHMAHSPDPRNLHRIVWTSRIRVGLDLYWLREVLRGTLCGDVGAPVPECFQVDVRFTAAAPLQVTVCRDGEGYLRLRCFPMSAPAGKVEALDQTAQPAEASLLTDLTFGTTELAGGWRSLLAPPETLDETTAAARLRFDQTIGEEGKPYAAERLRQLAQAGLAFRARVLRAAVRALENKFAVEFSAALSRASEDTPLVDCRFSPDDRGLAAFRDALDGDFTLAMSAGGGCAQWHEGQVQPPPQERFLELHMPFLEKREFRLRFQLYSTLEAEATDDGVIRVHAGGAAERVERYTAYQGALILASELRAAPRASEFTFGFTDRRLLSPAQARSALPRVAALYQFDESVDHWLVGLPRGAEAVEAALSLTIPGDLASIWLQLPAVRTARFTDLFADVAAAVQRSLRTWLAYAYFQDIERYEDPESAWPVLLYEACRPYSRKKRPDFTYDVMNPASLDMALKRSSGALPAILRSVFQLLVASGRGDLAEHYHPRLTREIIHSVRRGHRPFIGLLAADSYVVDALVKLASRARELKLSLDERAAGAKLAHRPLVECMESIHSRLRRLYDRKGYASLGPLMLIEATRALRAATEGKARPLKAVLKVRTRTAASATEHIFVNDGWRR
ncbi:MAG: hypothetical protein KIT09_26910 [Bryobacteraceae bacterium]|nr:hypothetical protein [Bryobacteraceae bacterium]